METIFTDIYRNNLWFNKHKSGGGADDLQTYIIRQQIPKLVENYKINSLLDCPCGDINYMKQIFHLIPNYTGCDIVEDLINTHKKTFPNKNFIKLNISEDKIPLNDLILCRDLFVHFSYDAIKKTIKNIKSSGCKYILMTTFTNRNKNEELNRLGYDWRTLNFEIEPFNFPKPLYIINENCSEGDNMYKDKSLGLWEIKDLPDFN